MKSKPIIILGIESSCDDTSAAIIQDRKILSNIIELRVLCSKTVESTALGAAYLAGIGAGEVSLQDVSKVWSPKAEYNPDSNYDLGRYDTWKEFLNRLIS